jgi:prefoldin subunit 5
VNPKPKSIDERLEAITQQLELVSHMQQTSEERIERLEKLAEGNEKRWDRLTRAFEAGLREYFSDNGDGEEN